MSALSEALKLGRFVVTSELGLPKGVDITEILSHFYTFGNRS